MAVAVTMAVEGIMIVVMIVRGGFNFAFGIAEHHGLHHTAKRIFRQRHMRGNKPGEPRENQRLHRKPLIAAHLIGSTVRVDGFRQKLPEHPV